MCAYVLYWKHAQQKVNHCSRKMKKGEKEKTQIEIKKENKKPSKRCRSLISHPKTWNVDFSACPNMVVKHGASGKKGIAVMLQMSCWVYRSSFAPGQKSPKNVSLTKSSGNQWVNIILYIYANTKCWNWPWYQNISYMINFSLARRTAFYVCTLFCCQRSKR